MRFSRRQFEDAVERALASIPPAFRPYMEGVVVEIEDSPDEQTIRELGMDDPGELLGMYFGTPITERGEGHDILLPDRVVVYQHNLEAMCESREELIEEIYTTVLHEVGHHFGLSEEHLDELGYG